MDSHSISTWNLGTTIKMYVEIATIRATPHSCYIATHKSSANDKMSVVNQAFFSKCRTN